MVGSSNLDKRDIDTVLVRAVALLCRYSNGKPALVFCGSKKDTETLAASLAQGTDYARRTGSQVILYRIWLTYIVIRVGRRLGMEVVQSLLLNLWLSSDK